MFLSSCAPAATYQVGCSGVATLSSYSGARRVAEDSMQMQVRYLREGPDYLGRRIQATRCGQLEDNSWHCIAPCAVIVSKQSRGSMM